MSSSIKVHEIPVWDEVLLNSLLIFDLSGAVAHCENEDPGVESSGLLPAQVSAVSSPGWRGWMNSHGSDLSEVQSDAGKQLHTLPLPQGVKQKLSMLTERREENRRALKRRLDC